MKTEDKKGVKCLYQQTVSVHSLAHTLLLFLFVSLLPGRTLKSALCEPLLQPHVWSHHVHVFFRTEKRPGAAKDTQQEDYLSATQYP